MQLVLALPRPDRTGRSRDLRFSADRPQVQIACLVHVQDASDLTAVK